jgi:hypothetical protein
MPAKAGFLAALQKCLGYRREPRETPSANRQFHAGRSFNLVTSKVFFRRNCGKDRANVCQSVRKDGVVCFSFTLQYVNAPSAPQFAGK